MPYRNEIFRYMKGLHENIIRQRNPIQYPQNLLVFEGMEWI